MDPPDVSSLSLSPNKGGQQQQQQRTPPRPPSPALVGGTHSATGTPVPPSVTPSLAAGLQLDMSLGSAVSALVHHLAQPLSAHCSHATIMDLRKRLTTTFTTAFAPTWNESNPHSGSGTRSLIADRQHGLPRLLREAAAQCGVDTAVWQQAIAANRTKKAESDDNGEEWEVWCDPGMVVWRWGGWGWEEPDFDPIKRPRESFKVVWQAAPTTEAATSDPSTSPAAPTPLRISKAIPIRAPTLNTAPSTLMQSLLAAADPSRTPSPGLLPAADISPRRAHSRNGSTSHARNSSHPFRTGSGHNKGQESTSSNSSDSSDTNSGHTHLLTPASRPGSAELFAPRGGDASKAPTPTTAVPQVTPYDGGNVTVLGGGTKLGGGGVSRSSSAMGMRGHDRTRSPSVSIVSRALNTAVGPNSNGGGPLPASPRKQRTRRRIIPTHIGYFGQPGIGGPIMGAFGSKPPQPGAAAAGFGGWPHGQPGGVGVGVGPPALPLGLKR
ncbi:hypothetical protein VHUM_01632 [Vanrija humicola]|uniref:Anti-proliferative protein domain-containing protein n=1 Tax=Vanrija humicola TaxID=5417 RepID=A0A7D8YYS5_VANHU|nr:hypothetical protein VHUM_01632 [Vanrija humicola]